MTQAKFETLISYIKNNVGPILIDFHLELTNAIYIPANCSINELNGHYEGTDYIPPKWYQKLNDNSSLSALIINDIDTIPLIEQAKFIELLKYRKISTFELPDNCVIIITAKNIDNDNINEELYSLVIHI